jgi:hypothetical protein
MIASNARSGTLALELPFPPLARTAEVGTEEDEDVDAEEDDECVMASCILAMASAVASDDAPCTAEAGTSPGPLAGGGDMRLPPAIGCKGIKLAEDRGCIVESLLMPATTSSSGLGASARPRFEHGLGFCIWRADRSDKRFESRSINRYEVV